jgi:CheY-like chemotaxis protein
VPKALGTWNGALDLLDRNAQIELVILDFAMPSMNGIEVARQVRINVPSCPVIFVINGGRYSAILTM